MVVEPRRGLCSAADRSRLPCRAGLGRVEQPPRESLLGAWLLCGWRAAGTAPRPPGWSRVEAPLVPGVLCSAGVPQAVGAGAAGGGEQAGLC